MNKNSFCILGQSKFLASDSEPPPWRKNSARKRARISEFPRKIRANRMGVPSACPFLGFEETAKYYSGVSIVPSPNLFSKQKLIARAERVVALN